MDRKYKILLAEDEEFISRMYRAGLEKAGFEIIIAFDGKETMRKVKSEKPDLILLDLIMPFKNGFEVLEELKKNDELEKIPVIVLSNLGQESDVEKAKKLGAKDYLLKTDVRMKEVIGKIEEYLVKG